MTLKKNLEPKSYEQKWWDFWQANNFFHAETDSKKPTYTILIPPPNVTDRLHMGHGLNNTIQDILIRYKRMTGFNCCWLPGTDHAGIATQMMVEKSLLTQGLTRKALGREAFLEKCAEWKDKNGNVIVEQQKKLGASCDWSRQAYTMDESLSKAVREIFVDLFNKGLIYRGKRLVNWDPKLGTAISDDELENKEINSQLHFIKYTFADKPEQFLTVATTRPETIFGDTAIAVNPTDERYQAFIGQYVEIPLTAKKIKIIGDDYVKTDFGTGCLKVTPCHDPNDFVIGKRHNLDFINVLNDDATLNENCPPKFQGLDREKARANVVLELKSQGLHVKSESYRHSVPFSDRSKVPIEPKLSEQWFVKMADLAQPAILAAKSGELSFFPSSYKKTYLHWLENIQDWCISRQLWWGHRIPVWSCLDCQKVQSFVQAPTSCSACSSTNLEQDADVLDTWFSSWLWPLSPFGWPKQSKDLEKFFPSNVLVTGPDIIYLWVARMIMAGYHATNKLAFKDVYFNAIICDKDGRKFSKTLGNGIDPLMLIDRHGADAVRYTCVSLAPLGGRVKMAVEDFDLGHRFINKLWNAALFLERHLEKEQHIVDFSPKDLKLWMAWLVTQIHETSEKVASNFDNYRINEAVEQLFALFWRNFCDWGLECAKEALESSDKKERQQVLSFLVYCFDLILRLLAPVIPFVTEEIWQSLPAHPRLIRAKSLVVANYPGSEVPAFPEQTKRWLIVQNLIGQVRSLRTQALIPLQAAVEIYVTAKPQEEELFREAQSWLEKLAKVTKSHFVDESQKPANALVSINQHFTLYLPVGEYLDIAKERARLVKEKQRLLGLIAAMQQKLNDPKYQEKAPKEIQEKTKAQADNLSAQLASLEVTLNSLPN